MARKDQGTEGAKAWRHESAEGTKFSKLFVVIGMFALSSISLIFKIDYTFVIYQ